MLPGKRMCSIKIANASQNASQSAYQNAYLNHKKIARMYLSSRTVALPTVVWAKRASFKKKSSHLCECHLKRMQNWDDIIFKEIPLKPG